MRFIPHTPEDIELMLETIGVSSVDELFAGVPNKLRLRDPLAVPQAASEQEVWRELSRMAAKNANAESHDWFLGAGTYAHFSPSAADALISRAEFMTAYTPYQPEISQGTLQATFEWQTMVCGLTGLEVANASLYDGASACAEAALMTMRITKRSRIVVSGLLHPHYREVLDTYLGGLQAEIVEVPRAADGRTGDLAAAIDDATACVLVQQPNFLGVIEDLAAAADAAHAHGAQLVTVVNEGRLGAGALGVRREDLEFVALHGPT